MNYYYDRLNNERFVGPILPFLAGVLATTPFIYLAKNNQNQIVQPYPIYQPYGYPIYSPYPFYGYPRVYSVR